MRSGRRGPGGTRGTSCHSQGAVRGCCEEARLRIRLSGMMRFKRFFPSLLALTACAGSILSGTAACAQDWAKMALDKSPRHREYVTVEHDGRKVNTFVVYPEVKTKAPVVVLIHEIFGESDWFKLQADELAEKGFIVLAPDLLSGMGPDGGGTDSLGGQDKVT